MVLDLIAFAVTWETNSNIVLLMGRIITLFSHGWERRTPLMRAPSSPIPCSAVRSLIRSSSLTVSSRERSSSPTRLAPLVSSLPGLPWSFMVSATIHILSDMAADTRLDLFQTDHRDPNISQTSSYLDLSTLYGDNQEDQDKIRTFKDGKLKPDCYSEPRLIAFPPACSVILVMLNRLVLIWLVSQCRDND